MKYPLTDLPETTLSTTSELTDNRNLFLEQGYFIVKGVYSPDEISSLRKMVFRLYCKFNPPRQIITTS